MTILLQPSDSPEPGYVGMGALLEQIATRRVAYADLGRYADLLHAGEAMPVGSVEFVREAMRVGGIPEPENISYVSPVQPFLRRRIERRTAGSVLGTWFVKPVRTKQFTGFVFDTLSDPASFCDHDFEQWQVFSRLPPETEVWVSEPVTFVCEWRYYVLDNHLLGRVRYDPYGEDDAPQPDQSIVDEAIEAMQQPASDWVAPRSYALDFGVLDSGATALVEANDAWALGLYGAAMSPRTYLHMLRSRWEQIVQDRATK
jgi:hypothetical protein